MLKHVKKQIALIALLAVSANISQAAEPDIPSLNADEGRMGEVRRVVDESEFKVCADPDNMPFSNSKQEGFEDKIAEVLAKDLGRKLSYTYAYNRQGFLRNTLNAMRCDVVMSTTADNDAMRTTKPYYRSGHVFVWRKDSNFNITDWSSPDLRKGFIGVVDHSPATIPMDANNLIGNARPYRIQRDLNLPPSFMIDDLAKGDIDIAISWGPIGGYFAKQSKVPMVVALIPEYETNNAKGKEFWNISVGVRKKDKERMAMIQGALDRNQDKIIKILDDYGIPHVAVVEGDSLAKSYQKYGASNKTQEAK
ncbi:quinoprotein dehydrogenase-associated putative ABC transporter substrate-binding protein [Methylotenera sp.]|uniref:quinoprotein dehydrogenase-associated putative ABC transporter substrate-binding protein n=1 Tax=Methylotenera sp. TaxID=2051956 RepID=UPI002731392A|nr:quinoprotein dehydrogenase-associated putative ABC transporter substrate-binding protein [Methylotenera sp.]MDP2070690.1 quinoprotein dehydrogenase-associated putative ABC transporter substrate-binding protein [Methylotenera sp.]MDP3004829.1 quinoprotein dehydrogenase-associated putative ABC transporter substrate-binding protein [Methylotenera sp.]